MERRSSYFPKMAIGNGIMRSRSPWVNLFYSPPDQAKSKKSQGNPEMQSKSCRNDGRLVYGARRRTSYSSGRRPCRHRTHWAVRAPDFLVVFFIVFSHHIIEGIPRICPILCIYSHFVSLTPCTEILHCPQNDLPRKNTLDSMKKTILTKSDAILKTILSETASDAL